MAHLYEYVVSSRLRRRVNGERFLLLWRRGIPPERLEESGLLALGRTHEVELWPGPRMRKALVLLVALISSVFAFASAAGEARAEPLPQTPQQPAEVTGGEVARPVAERPTITVSPNDPVSVEMSLAVVAPLETAPAGKPSVETPAVEAAAAGALPTDTPAGESLAPQAPGPSPLPSAGSAVHPGPGTQLELVSGQPGRYGPETTLAPAPVSEHAAEPSDDARPAAGLVWPDSSALLPTGQEPEPKAGLAPDPVSDAGLAPTALTSTPEPLEPGLMLEAVAFEGGSLSPAAEEPPAPVEEELYLSSLSGSPGGAVEARTPETVAGWSLRPTEVDGGVFDVALANLFSGIEVSHTPENELAENPGVSLAGPTGPVESPLRDTPQPVSPFAPPVVGNAFSLSGSSVLGSGGLTLLLFCILVAGPIVLRRDSKLVLTLRELPKPNSALNLPLERPG